MDAETKRKLFDLEVKKIELLKLNREMTEEERKIFCMGFSYAMQNYDLFQW